MIVQDSIKSKSILEKSCESCLFFFLNYSADLRGAAFSI